jgi:AmmeMemoRadiSam system protein B/AmmeMemoRadiSam system protein A
MGEYLVKMTTAWIGRVFLLLILVSLMMNITATGAGGMENEGTSGEGVRPSTLAGSWYDADPEALAATVDRYLEEAGDPPKSPGLVVGLVAPHAGYVYSGRCAAHAYKTVAGRDIRRVILMGPSHTARCRGLVIPESSFFATPLGRVEVDQAACRYLEAQALFSRGEAAHEKEHSLEIQLPFLQRTLRSGFKIIPLVVGELAAGDYAEAAAALRSLCDDQTLVVVSTDFTHYGDSFGYVPFTTDVEASLAKLDGDAVERILELDLSGFLSYQKETGATICGFRPIGILISLFGRGWDRGEISLDNLHYTTSATGTGDWSHVVSYQALAVRSEAPAAGGEEVDDSTAETAEARGEPVSAAVGSAGLNQGEEALLLGLARETLRLHILEGRRPPAGRGATLPPILSEQRGAFVTLHKRGRLRGCIGYIQARKPLWETVVDNTINAATGDPRFAPVSSAELAQLDIEISVLSPLEKLSGPDKVEVGRHGLYIVKGFSSGLLLPQVPTEQGWDRETFLENLCLKAGLERDAYLRGAELYAFTAQVFGESTEAGAHGER